MINISNVVNVSVSAPPSGLAPYSVNNLLCLTDNTPVIAPSGAYATYSSASDVATDWGSGSDVYKAAVAVFAQSPNIITGGGLFIVAPLVGAETLTAAILRLQALVYFGGVSFTHAPSSAERLAAAVTCQAQSKLLFLVSSSTSDLLGPNGLFFKVQDQKLTQARCLLHTDSTQAPGFLWGYAGRGMSVDFAGSNTTSTMHLKQIAGVSSDAGLTQTILGEAQAVGADVYASIAGRASVISYGANAFFDDQYNLNWFVGALQIAGFNYLAQSSTKVPQTEAGMDGLKGAYRFVCIEGTQNAFVAPGQWNSSDTFGNPDDFRRNISTVGYFIYSLPIAQQLQSDRALRKAPLVQIAVKYAGAIHSSNVIVYFNQ